MEFNNASLRQPPDCDFVHHLNQSERCSFVMHNPGCSGSAGFINYVQFYYCIGDARLVPLAFLGLVQWMIMLFIGIGLSADHFFCPNLSRIAKSLKMSQNIAGVTLMAFGNGAADIFSSLAAMSQSRPELLLGELFGAATFLSTCVAGAVAIAAPFKVMERPFLRDVVFCYIVGFWAFYIFYRGTIFLSDAIGFLLLYLVYITVVIVGRLINAHFCQNSNPEPDRESILSDQSQDEENEVSIFEDVTTDTEGPDMRATEPELDDLSSVQLTQPSASNPSSFVLAIKTLFKMEGVQFWASPWWIKAWSMIKAPINFILNVTVPVVNDAESESGWSYRMHQAQLFLAPVFICFALRLDQVEVRSGLYAWQVALALGQVLQGTFTVFATPEAPWRPLHTSLAYAGFLVAIVWIYLIANEIVALIKLWGVLMGLSDAILGLTVLAWGNSIADLVADLSIAKQGKPRTGFSACFGGPLFNMLLGIGIPFSFALIRRGEPITIEYNPMVLVLSGCLGTALSASFIVLPILGFKANRKYGLYLIFVYLCIISTALTLELVVLK